MEEPKDLGVKIGTPEEAAWTTIRDGAKKEIEQMNRSILMAEQIIKLAEKIIAKEKKCM
jgi:hypothetical protein